MVAALASVTSFYASARALQDGDAVPVIAITGTAANIVGIAGGMVVFGDPLPGDTLGIVLQAVGFLLVVAAGALLPAPVRAARIEAAPDRDPSPRPAGAAVDEPRPLTATFSACGGSTRAAGRSRWAVEASAPSTGRGRPSAFGVCAGIAAASARTCSWSAWCSPRSS